MAYSEIKVNITRRCLLSCAVLAYMAGQTGTGSGKAPMQSRTASLGPHRPGLQHATCIQYIIVTMLSMLCHWPVTRHQFEWSWIDCHKAMGCQVYFLNEIVVSSPADRAAITEHEATSQTLQAPAVIAIGAYTPPAVKQQSDPH